MTLPPAPDPGAADAPRTTLGDLLYADRNATRPLEEDWAALVRSIAAGDQAALRALYDRMHRLVFTLAFRITGDRETAEELTVDVFHGVWQRAGDYDPETGPVVAWVMNHTRSRAIDRLRFEHRKRRTNPYPDEPAVGSAGTSPSDAPQQALAASEHAVRVRDAVKRLEPGERAAIEAAFFSELTHAETAARLEQPLGTVKTRIRSGLRKLREALAGAEGEP